MSIETRLNILNNGYYNYLKENSYWIKELSRSSNNFEKFREFIKDKYSLRLSNKLEDITDKISFISNVLNTLK